METSENSTEQNTEEQLTFLQEDSPASHSPQQEREREQKTTASFGQKCYESYERFSQHGSSLKTCVASLVSTTDWYSSVCALKWKPMATKSNRFVFQLAPSVRHIGEKECGLSLAPTPVASDGTTGGIIGKDDTFRQTKGLPRKINRNGKDGSVGLARLVQMIPTPTTRDWKGARKPETLALAGRNATNSLEDTLVALLPTPTANDFKGAASSPNFKQKRVQDVLTALLPTPDANCGDRGVSKVWKPIRKSGQPAQFPVNEAINQIGQKTGVKLRLQPAMTAWMMGFPKDYTVLPFLSGEKKV